MPAFNISNPGTIRNLFPLLFSLGCAAPPPDILLITLDTTRADALGAYGRAPSPTPNLDAFARRGTRFREAMTTVPLTLPAHTSLMTGRYPDAHGLRDNGEGTLSADATTLAEQLRGAGYQTGAFVGAIVLDGAFGLAQGFDTYEDGFDLTGSATPGDAVVSWPASVVLDRAARWHDNGDPRPRLTWIHLYDAHAPYTPPEPFDGDLYLGEVAALDTALAPWLSLPDTLTVVTADHGEGRGDHGEQTHGLFVYRSTMSVPLLLGGPGIPATEVGGIASLVDIAPTLLDLAGAAPLPDADGLSLRPALQGAPLPADRVVCGESLHGRRQYGLAELRVLADQQHRYIRAPRPELYDHRADPDEQHPLDAALHAGWEARLSALLARGAAPLSAAPVLAADTRAALAQLGYLSEPPLVDAQTPYTALPDPKDHPDVVSAFESLIVAARSRPPAEAVPLLEAFLAEHPGVSTGWLLLSMARELSGDPDGALAALAPLRAARPDDPMLWTRVAGLELSAGRLGAAAEAAARAQHVGPTAAMASALLAEVQRQQGDCAQAIRTAEAALATAPEASALRRVRGLCAFEANDPTAQADLEAADPSDPAVRYALGALAAVSGDMGAAEAWFSGLPEATRSGALGRLRYQQGRHEEAIALLSGHDDAEALVLLADARLRVEGPGPAIDALLDAAALRAPGEPRVHRIRSALRMAEGDVAGALAEMEEAGRDSQDSAVHWR